jgi:hypothetical protein
MEKTTSFLKRHAKFINDNAGTIVALLAAAAAFGSWYESHMTRKSQDSLVQEQIKIQIASARPYISIDPDPASDDDIREPSGNIYQVNTAPTTYSMNFILASKGPTPSMNVEVRSACVQSTAWQPRAVEGTLSQLKTKILDQQTVAFESQSGIMSDNETRKLRCPLTATEQFPMVALIQAHYTDVFHDSTQQFDACGNDHCTTACYMASVAMFGDPNEPKQLKKRLSYQKCEPYIALKK